MKRTEPMSLGDIMRQAVESLNMEEHLREVRASRIWPAIVGDGIASQTGTPYVENGRMTVKVPSAALRQELQMHRSVLMRALNQALGQETVTSIRFTS